MSLYVPPSGSTDPNASYVGKNVAAGTQGSKVPPGAVEYPQREIVNAISSSGQSPTNSDLFQLWKAILAGAKSVINTLKIPGRTPWRQKTAGNYTLNLAAGTTFSVDYLYGAGGGGGGSTNSVPGNGGGGGARATKTGIATTATVLAITIGAGGPGGAAASSNPPAGGAGGTSSIVVQSGSVTGVDGTVYGPGSTLCACTGGAGGYGYNPSNVIAQGGIASGGDQNDNGDNGGLLLGTSSTFFVSGNGGASPGNSTNLFAQTGTQVTSSSPGVGGSGAGALLYAGTKGSDGGVLIYK